MHSIDILVVRGFKYDILFIFIPHNHNYLSHTTPPYFIYFIPHHLQQEVADSIADRLNHKMHISAKLQVVTNFVIGNDTTDKRCEQHRSVAGPKSNVPVIIRHDKIRCNTPTFVLEHHMTTSFWPSPKIRSLQPLPPSTITLPPSWHILILELLERKSTCRKAKLPLGIIESRTKN